jgi:hypothetical protein
MVVEGGFDGDHGSSARRGMEQASEGVCGSSLNWEESWEEERVGKKFCLPPLMQVQESQRCKMREKSEGFNG